ncbi:MAG: ATP-binding cassette domain-containing protein [Desulfobaccales bacterium]
MAILETKALTRCFNGYTAVDALTIALEAGEVFGLLGPNGAGKTTTIKMLTTLLPPTSGTASVAGFDIVRQARDVRRAIGYVPQLVSADGSLTGYENLLIFAKLYDIPRAERQARIRDALALIGLTEAGDRMVREYSGGMIRRLEIAQSMLHRPRVLFLDEPSSGLDPVARRTVWEHIEELRRSYGTTIMITTHLMEEADHLCQRVAIMHLGRVAAIGTPEALKASLGGDQTTLDDVFVHYAGGIVESGGAYREVSRTRRTAERLG